MLRDPNAPKYGFSIMSDGSVLRGDPGTYDEEQVTYWYNQWVVMKALGIFDKKPHEETVDKGSSSSDLHYTPIEDGKEFNEKGIEQKPVDPVVPEPKPNKKKKNSKRKGKKGRK